MNSRINSQFGRDLWCDDWRDRAVRGRGGQIERINLTIVVEMPAGAIKLGILLMGEIGNAGLAMDPCGMNRVVDDLRSGLVKP